MTALLDLDAMTSADLRELASAKAMREDPNARRAPEPPVVVEDPETAAAWERRCQERSNREARAQRRSANPNSISQASTRSSSPTREQSHVENCAASVPARLTPSTWRGSGRVGCQHGV
jgi:hypothetical protein